MSVIRIATTFNIELEFTLAPFHKRLIAWALDLLLQVMYLMVAMRFLRWLNLQMSYSPGNSYNNWAIELLLLLPFWIYHLLCEVLMNGQSIGKRLLGLRVVHENGGRPGMGSFVIRWLIRTSDYMLLSLLLYAPYAMMFGARFFYVFAGALLLLLTDVVLVNSNKKSQRLGDLLAHTMLICITKQAALKDTVFTEVDETHTPLFPQVMQLSDRDINSLKSILHAARKQNDHKLAASASRKIQAHLNLQTDLPPIEFLETLLRDYNHLSAE